MEPSPISGHRKRNMVEVSRIIESGCARSGSIAESQLVITIFYNKSNNIEVVLQPCGMKLSLAMMLDDRSLKSVVVAIVFVEV